MAIFKIYKHINKINGKVYIGQTMRTINERKRHYYKTNKHFNSAIKKYGWENFETVILEKCKTQKEADHLETKYILLFEANNRTKGYNKSIGGEHPILNEEKRKEYAERMRKLTKNNIGVPLSEEHKRKISESRKGKCVGKDHPFYKRELPAEELERLRQANLGRPSGVNKEIYQLDLEGNYIKEWDSAKKAGETLNINTSSITRCCKGKRVTAGGYKWKYKKESE